MALYASDSTINKGEPYRNYIEEETEAGKTPPSSMLPSNDYIPTAPDQTYSEASGIPHFVDKQGGIYPVNHNSILYEHSPQQVAEASKPKLSMEDYLYSVKPPGGFSDPTEYWDQVYKGARVVAQDQGIDLNSERGKEWLTNTIKGGAEFGSKVVNQTPAKDRYLKTGEDSYFDTVSKKIVKGPHDLMNMHIEYGTAQREAQQGQADGQGQAQPPNPAGYIPPQTGQPATPAKPETREDRINKLKSVDRETYFKGRGIKDPNKELSAKDILTGAEAGVDVSKFYFPGTDVVDSKSFLEAVGQSKGKKAETAGLDEGTIDDLAKRFAKTGKMDITGMGNKAADMKAAVLKRWSQMLKDDNGTAEDQLADQAGFKAAQSELSQLQAQRGKVMAFAITADKNLKVAEELSDKVDRTGSPVVNRWLLAGKKSLAGDPDVAAYDAAIRIAINEVAKVTSSATGGQVTSDAARREIEDALNSAQTPEQVKAVIDKVLRKDMENRKAGYDEQIQTIESGMAKKPKGKKAEAKTYKTLKELEDENPPDGTKVTVDGKTGTWKHK